MYRSRRRVSCAAVLDPRPNEQVQFAEEAREAQRLTPEQRVELFASIMNMIQGIWQSLPFEEQWRRLGIGETIDGPRPSPWGPGVRQEAQP